ncbi:GtrA family protein [Microvirga yunnanensis]|uniref:GtrA family protein n=1 Tax=Microvirga yunnanensis TaxID=2953740 RepID=UPI0021C58F08|nr:GtrA family protein [Microvirga sp. HBU65207]
MNRRTPTLRYAAFAAIATVVNITTQNSVLQLGDASDLLALAMIVGTIAGLLTKYLLDKLWIFYDQEIGLKSDGWKFSLYTAVGGLTTIISWSAEAASWTIWGTEVMRDVGAFVGLTIGYMVRFQLDKRFVFSDRQGRIAP